jgi:pyruvate/2-oxoglutarate dehydrogenase complex dihydrolipoamide dehydrogenase (E3) component
MKFLGFGYDPTNTTSIQWQSCFLMSVLFWLLLLPSSCAAMAASSPPSTTTYDVVIIGGGAAGLTAAKVAATFGKSAVIVEQARMGGDCTWTGCVPSKSLIAAAKAAHMIKTARTKFGGVGVAGGALQIDMKAIKERIQSKIQHIHDEEDSPEAMAKLGINTIVGKKATFVNTTTLSLQSFTSSSSNSKDTDDKDTAMLLHAKMGIVICTGASPVEPTNDMIAGIDTVPHLTYEQIFELEEIPTRLTVVGGGPIGCELAQAFSRLGATVTQVAER